LSIFFALSGSARVKAARRMWMKWNPSCIPFSGEVISREKIERNFDFDDWITSGGFDQTQIGKIAPRLVRKVLDSAENNNNNRG